ncbi:MAG TPA: alpha-L-rhamnosidase C-terminal domain-containing protein, partial [Verrucomicrobiae bacterium]
YEADAYINELSHYACDLDPRVAHDTLEYLLKHPTWPTEWSLHMPMMGAADYEATGDTALAARNYEALKKKLLMGKARADGLLRAGAIVDWPEGERDGYNNGVKVPNDRQLGPEYNTVVNAFYYHALQCMQVLAQAVNKPEEAQEFAAKAKQVYASFNATFFDRTQGLYIDGEGSRHASLHANLFALDFGLAPADQQRKIADFVQSRGMACSVYGAQYLLETMFKSGKDDYALHLITAPGDRSWPHMIELGSTMTLEAWDAKYKPNLTWNHAWGAAPANMLSRFVLGVRPMAPGYRKILIAPQPGKLSWVRGKVPTALGPVTVSVENAGAFKLDVAIPAGAKAQLAVPRVDGAEVLLDGQKVPATADGLFLTVDDVSSGHHILERKTSAQ